MSIDKKQRRLEELEKERKFLSAAKQLENEEKAVRRRTKIEQVNMERQKQAEEIDK